MPAAACEIQLEQCERSDTAHATSPVGLVYTCQASVPAAPGGNTARPMQKDRCQNTCYLTCRVGLHMPSIHTRSLCKPINVHGVVPHQLASFGYLCQSLVAWPWLGLTRLCIDVSKKGLHQQHNRLQAGETKEEEVLRLCQGYGLFRFRHDRLCIYVGKKCVQ